MTFLRIWPILDKLKTNAGFMSNSDGLKSE